MHISTVYDRTNLINTTTRTVRHVVFSGLVLVTLVLISMLGDLRISFLAAITIPFAVLFAFSMMVLTGQSANLISIGAIDFGILVDASIVVLESIYRKLSRRTEDENNVDVIIEGASNAAKPVLFATVIILVAFIPLFTMQGVPGKIFAPMSVTYGFALAGALLFSLIFAPVLAKLIVPTHIKQENHETFLGSFLRRRYDKGLPRVLAHRRFTWVVAIVCLVGSGVIFTFVGGEFMPPLEEGNLWIRATLPQDISFDAAANIADKLREQIAKSPEVTQAVSQMMMEPTWLPSMTSKSPSLSSRPASGVPV
jgi:cobalt-zinc-cadmium resistance protein CzcA